MGADNPICPMKPAGKTLQTNRRFAARAHLRYVNDDDLKIQRIRFGKGFRYLSARHTRLQDNRTLARIQQLAIPPAWTDVWICQSPAGHLQAVGKDAKGRKQYRYHERWSELRNENKFDRMIEFGRCLPKIRRAVSRDLHQPVLTQTKVVAAIVRLLELSAVRVGNEQYADQNGSYGLTTLRNCHARVVGDNIKLRFRGKSGQEQEIDVRHPALARIVRKCQQLPGQKLFEYADDDGVHAVSSENVNDYLAQVTGDNFTAKDFRTWKATALAASTLIQSKAKGGKAKQKNVVLAIEQAAKHLGNTPAICRKCYIHPAILEGYLNNTLARFSLNQPAKRPSRNGLTTEEKVVLALLKKRKPSALAQGNNGSQTFPKAIEQIRPSDGIVRFNIFIPPWPGSSLNFCSP